MLDSPTTSIDTLIERIRNEDEYMPLARRCDLLNRTHRDLLDALKNLQRRTESIANNSRKYYSHLVTGEIMESPRSAADTVDRLMTKQNNLMTSIIEICGLLGIIDDIAECLVDVVLVDAANGLRF